MARDRGEVGQECRHKVMMLKIVDTARDIAARRVAALDVLKAAVAHPLWTTTRRCAHHDTLATEKHEGRGPSTEVVSYVISRFPAASARRADFHRWPVLLPAQTSEDTAQGRNYLFMFLDPRV